LINELISDRVGEYVRVDPFGTVLGASAERWAQILSAGFVQGFPQGRWYGTVGELSAQYRQLTIRTVDVEGLSFETLDRLEYLHDSGADSGWRRLVAFRGLENSHSEAIRRARVASEVVRDVAESMSTTSGIMATELAQFSRACLALEEEICSDDRASTQDVMLAAFQANTLA
jgi:hypothetical protein